MKKNKPDIVCEVENPDVILIVSYMPLEAWLSFQVKNKATSIKLTLNQAGILLNTHWQDKFPVFQQWRAEHGE